MRWESKKKGFPVDGDRRTIKRFHILPTYYFGYWVWLETVTIVQRYESNYADDGWKDEAIYHK